MQEARAQYTAAIDEPDESSSQEQKVYDESQLHQSRGAVLHMLGEEYAEDTAAAERLGVANAQATIAKLAMQMAQAFPGCHEAATNQVKAAVKKQEGNDKVKAKEFAKALECYSAALELDPSEHTIWYASASTIRIRNAHATRKRARTPRRESCGKQNDALICDICGGL